MDGFGLISGLRLCGMIVWGNFQITSEKRIQQKLQEGGGSIAFHRD